MNNLCEYIAHYLKCEAKDVAKAIRSYEDEYNCIYTMVSEDLDWVEQCIYELYERSKISGEECVNLVWSL